MKESIWSKTASFPERPPLSGDLNTDAAVIGGGMAGILTAHFLKKAGMDVVVLEASQVGSGQTKNTTAKITSQHNLTYHKLINQFGVELARQYADANQQAIEQFRLLIEENQIDCDFVSCPAYLYSQEEREPLVREMDAALRLGIPASCPAETELPFPIAGALRFDGQARFHPLKFLFALSEPLELYERTVVQSVEENRIQTNRGTVTADHIIFACHYPFINFPGYYFTRMHQERSSVIALENAAHLEGFYLGIDSDGLSFRPHENSLLLGGGSYRTGENSAGGQYQRLRDAAKRYWPQSRETAAWSAQDCMTLDGVPYIGRFSASAPNWYVATGFQKWGMTSSMVSALLISSLIEKGESQWEPVFSPQRFKPSASAKTFLKDAAQSVKGLTRKFFEPPREEIDALPEGHGGIVECEGEKIGVYKEKGGKVYLVSVRCPHLGCQLEWNPDEKSWDCPCHGSRFDYKGNLIDNPAQEGIHYEG